MKGLRGLRGLKKRRKLQRCFLMPVKTKCSHVDLRDLLACAGVSYMRSCRNSARFEGFEGFDATTA